MEESKQILVAVTALQENMKNMEKKIDEISNLSKLAMQTNESVKSAHNRIDDLKRDLDEKVRDQKTDYEEKIKVEKEAREKAEENITWLKRVVVGGFITFIFGAILLGVQFYYASKGGF